MNGVQRPKGQFFAKACARMIRKFFNFDVFIFCVTTSFSAFSAPNEKRTKILLVKYVFMISCNVLSGWVSNWSLTNYLWTISTHSPKIRIIILFRHYWKVILQYYCWCCRWYCCSIDPTNFRCVDSITFASRWCVVYIWHILIRMCKHTMAHKKSADDIDDDNFLGRYWIFILSNRSTLNRYVYDSFLPIDFIYLLFFKDHTNFGNLKMQLFESHQINYSLLHIKCWIIDQIFGLDITRWLICYAVLFDFGWKPISWNQRGYDTDYIVVSCRLLHIASNNAHFPSNIKA